ncbi:UDP-2,4-diacetamido-2,4,6-trideoxy-beta-L-altropyranose hydrolase [Clostridiaceae bacterium M8S5]|nr:UDP-2,4-diacetamido-2,4,6-trideoxy-beta-L-altropyranose hydrolase [Clostridiaceae bacterium M8S5]
MKKVAFRVDGGQSVGMGHIMRCVSLAKEFKRKGYDVYFISKLEKGIKLINDNGFDVIGISHKSACSIAGYNYGNEEELKIEIAEIKKFSEIHKFDILIIDSYNVTREYFLEMKKCAYKLCYIDDINKFVYPVDVLINGNITAKYMDYKKYSKDELMLLGLEYNLIRSEFKNLPKKKIKENIEEIMITTGGSDPYDMTVILLDNILKGKKSINFKINIVVGNGFKNVEELKKISENNKNIVLHINPKNMSEIMLKSDIAISSGGSTLYELCACGIPTITFAYADNQKFIVKKMDELGYVINVGGYSNINKELNKTFFDLIDNYELRYKMSEKQKKLFDKNGSTRVAEIVDLCILNNSIV